MCSKTDSIGNEPYTGFGDVRIYPAHIYFRNPFEGKKYEATMLFQNVGKRLAAIRILTPSSCYLKMRTESRDLHLGPGLNFKRKIRYKASMLDFVNILTIPIYINNKLLSYEVKILEDNQIEPSTTILNFGTIDAGPTVAQRFLTLTNKSSVPEIFKIDLTGDNLNLSISSLKGTILPHSHKKLSIELSMFEEGSYRSQFFVICSDPILITVLVTVVVGKIEALHEFAMKSFTFIHIPVTYLGTSTTVSMLLGSTSSRTCLFCVNGEHGSNELPLYSLLKSVDDFKQFNINPISGRLCPNEVRPFTFTYSPTSSTNRDKTFNLIVIKIIRLNCIEFSSKYSKDVFNTKHGDPDQLSEGSITSSHSLEGKPRGSSKEDDFQVLDASVPEKVFDLSSFFENFVRVMIYAETEIPSVSISPDELTFTDLTLKNTITRILQITNNSSKLPIYYTYVKCTFVDVLPKSGILKPKEKTEISVNITPFSLSDFHSYIQFNLLYHDEPNLNGSLKIIGSVEIPITIKSSEMEVRFDSKKPKIQPKNELRQKLIKENYILALPNDIPTSIRPWRSNKICRTIYGLPRITSVENYGPSVRIDKSKNVKAIMKGCEKQFYLVPKCQIPINAIGEVKLNTELILRPDIIPLTPQELNKIIITPRHTFMDKISVHLPFDCFVKIQNDNDMALRIFLRAHRPEFFEFPKGNRLVIKAKETINLHYICAPLKAGIQYFLIDIIVNESHIFETTLTMKLSSPMLELSFTEETFRNADPPYKYLELANAYNCDIDFEWMPMSNFTFEPSHGTVPARKSIICQIICAIDLCEADWYDLHIKIDCRVIKSIGIRVQHMDYPISISNVLPFGKIPVNVTRWLDTRLKNCGRRPFVFKVDVENLPLDLTIIPLQGTIAPNACQIIYIYLKWKEVGPFNIPIKIKIGSRKNIKIVVEGIASLPILKFVPNIIEIRKLPTSSFTVKSFHIENTTDIDAAINFDTDENMDMKICKVADLKYFTKDDTIWIKPYQIEEFAIHFHPLYAHVDVLTLPVIINGKNSSTENFKTIKVFYSTLNPKLSIKSWNLDFNFNGYNEDCKKSVAIENPTTSTIKFCIRLDDLKAPFSFEHIQGGTVTYEKAALICILEEKECVTFQCEFNPSAHGTYKVRMPLFIKDDYLNQIHNFLCFNGTYSEPKITCEQQEIFLGFIPLYFPITKIIRIKLLNHKSDCIIDIWNGDPTLKIRFETSLDDRSYLNLTLRYHSKQRHRLADKIQINCKCGTSLRIPCYGGADNNPLSTYAIVYHFRLIFGRSFFPDEDQSTLSNISMDNEVFIYKDLFLYFPRNDFFKDIVKVVEKWISEQCFRGKEYYIIPDSICRYEIQQSKTKTKVKSLDDILWAPLYDLLLLLCGTNLNQFCNLMLNPNQNRILFVYYFYDNILQMLIQFGCFVHNIHAEYLLPYENYKLYLKTTDRGNDILDHMLFYLISKQCWLDLLLQIYKVFVYERGTESKTVKNMPITAEVGINHFLHTDHCRILINWLNNSLSALEDITLMSPYKKTIKNFESDISDGIAFAAVTISHCPYLSKKIAGIYAPANTNEQRTHNCCLLVEAWNLINMHFSITPLDITSPNVVHMMIFTNYLYEFLKSMKRIDILKFNCNLSESCKETITITNDNDYTIRYQVIMFDNEKGSFQIDKHELKIEAHAQGLLQISFTGKFLEAIHSTLVVSGELAATKAAKSRVFNLNGFVTPKKPLKIFTLKSKLYAVENIRLNIKSPFKKEVKYELYFCHNISSCPIIMEPYSDYLPNMSLLRLRPLSPMCTSNQDGDIDISVKLCSFSNAAMKVWIFFKGTDEGDFFIQVMVQTISKQFVEHLDLFVPHNFAKTICACKDKVPDVNNKRCPKNVTLKIPSKNKIFWNAVFDYFIEGVAEGDHTFWNKYKASNAGLVVLKRVLEHNRKFISLDLSFIFKDMVTYHTALNEKNYIAQSELTILNISSTTDTTDMVIHIGQIVDSFILQMESIDKEESRYYKVSIIHKKNMLK